MDILGRIAVKMKQMDTLNYRIVLNIHAKYLKQKMELPLFLCVRHAQHSIC